MEVKNDDVRIIVCLGSLAFSVILVVIILLLLLGPQIFG